MKKKSSRRPAKGAPQDQKQESGPRIAVFTHDTFGLGHVRRSTHLMRALSQRLPDSSLLLITGSPALHRMPPLPPNADFVKIPTIVRTGAEDRRPPHLRLPIHRITSLRKRITRSAILEFDPDVFVVDNFPLGSRRELLPILEELRERKTKTVLGLRDILDTPETVQENWTRDGTYGVLEDLYDHVLVYGVRRIFDLAKAYELSPKAAGKLTYCGYVTDHRPLATSRVALRRRLGVRKPFVLATGGGGGDAYPLLSNFVEAAKAIPKCSALVLTGPLMAAADRRELERRAARNPQIQFMDFVPDVREYIAAADAVVSMCGYNSASELLAQSARTLVVPRDWQYGQHVRRDNVIQEGEQVMRAEALSRRGLVRMLSPSELDPETLARELKELLKSPPPSPGKRPSLRGMENAGRFLANLATS